MLTGRGTVAHVRGTDCFHCSCCSFRPNLVSILSRNDCHPEIAELSVMIIVQQFPVNTWIKPVVFLTVKLFINYFSYLMQPYSWPKCTERTRSYLVITRAAGNKQMRCLNKLSQRFSGCFAIMVNRMSLRTEVAAKSISFFFVRVWITGYCHVFLWLFKDYCSQSLFSLFPCDTFYYW